jgi:hypothetical protein
MRNERQHDRTDPLAGDAVLGRPRARAHRGHCGGADVPTFGHETPLRDFYVTLQLYYAGDADQEQLNRAIRRATDAQL